MTYAFTITTVAATAADLVKLKAIEKVALKAIKEYYGNSFATSGGCA